MALVEFHPAPGSISSFSSLTITGANGSTMVWEPVTQVIADLSVAQVTVNLVPPGANLLFVTGIVLINVVTDAATNTFSAGDGVDPDRWGLNILGAALTAWSQADFTAPPGGWDAAAQDVTFTPPGAEAFLSGSVRVVAYIQTVTPPTS